MIKPVQRWNLGNISIKQEDNETGEFVLYDDHQIVVDALRARVSELEGKLGICRASLDHPVNCPRCEASFLPYIDPNEVRGIAPDQLREALKP